MSFPAISLPKPARQHLRYKIGHRHWEHARLRIGEAGADGGLFAFDFAGDGADADAQSIHVALELFALRARAAAIRNFSATASANPVSPSRMARDPSRR